MADGGEYHKKGYSMSETIAFQYLLLNIMRQGGIL